MGTDKVIRGDWMEPKNHSFLDYETMKFERMLAEAKSLLDELDKNHALHDPKYAGLEKWTDALYLEKDHLEMLYEGFATDIAKGYMYEEGEEYEMDAIGAVIDCMKYAEVCDDIAEERRRKARYRREYKKRKQAKETAEKE